MGDAGQTVQQHLAKAYTFPDAPPLCFRIGLPPRYLSPIVFHSGFSNLDLLTCKELA